MVFPDIWWGEAKNGGQSAFDTWARALEICLAIGLNHGDGPSDNIEVEVDDNDGIKLPHAKSMIYHPGFALGQADVWVVGGPQFDAISKESVK